MEAEKWTKNVNQTFFDKSSYKLFCLCPVISLIQQ